MLDLDNGIENARLDPELYQLEYYEYYQQDPCFVCIWHSGLRISEIAGIYPENIKLDTETSYLDIKRQPS